MGVDRCSQIAMEKIQITNLTMDDGDNVIQKDLNFSVCQGGYSLSCKSVVAGKARR
jgi:hypothetical protein